MTRDETDTAQALQQQLAELTQQYESLHRSVDAVHGALNAERRRAARYTAIARIGRLSSSSLSLHDIFQIAVESIYEQLDFAYIAVALSTPTTHRFCVSSSTAASSLAMCRLTTATASTTALSVRRRAHGGRFWSRMSPMTSATCHC